MMGDATVTDLVQVSAMGSDHELIATPLSWEEPLTTFDGWMVAASLPRSTRKMRRYQLRRFALMTATDPFDVTLEDIMGYLRMNPKWSANTKASFRTTIRAFYRWAKETGRIRRNPAKSVPVVKVPAGRPRPAAQSVIDEALLRAPAREALMIELATYAGLRCCEVATVHTDNLQVRYVDGTRRAILEVKGKGDKTRVLPIKRDALVDEILDANGYLFPGQIDGHISAAYVSRLVSRALGPTATAHKLRHRFATEALRGTRNLRALQEALGHANLNTTQIYTDVIEDDLWAIVEAAA